MKKNLDDIVKTIKLNRKTPVVGIDIDNTLFNIPTVEFINKTFGTSYVEEDVTDWSFKNFPDHIRKAVLEKFVDPDFMCRLQPDWDTYGTIRDWCSKGAKIYGVTRRAGNLVTYTDHQINKNFPGLFQDVFYVRPHESKTKYLTHIGATHHIDDWDVEDSIDAGIQTWLIANKHTMYNSHLRTHVGLYQAESVKYVKLEHSKWNG
jgi:hypothetical protein